jgi:hypothetical protein
MSFIIDLDRGIVSSSWTGFEKSSITDATESKISFEGAKPEYGTWKGAVDRYSGAVLADFSVMGAGYHV